MSSTVQAFVTVLPTRLSSSSTPFAGAERGAPRARWLLKRARRGALRMQDGPSEQDDDPPEPERAADDDPTEVVDNRDWREFRAALVVGSVEKLEKTKETAYRTGHWAHSLSLPETGCFLASHPAYYRRSAPYLTQAVVFLTKYELGAGATGLVLNRPLRGSVAELETDGMFGRSSKLASTPLGTQPVYIGGPDLIESGVVTALHGNDKLDMSGVREPLDGVFVGDVSHCLMGIEGGLTKPADVRLFAGCLRWAPGELEREVDEGSWYCVSASPLFALKHCIQLPKPLWVEIMQSQGKPFAQIASQVYDEESEK